MLIDRASGGADHLGVIIKSLLESTRLEQMVQQADREPVVLPDWYAGALMRYRQVFPDVTVEIDGQIPPVILNVSPELLQQAFDKLVDNAVSYSMDDCVRLFASLDGQGAATHVSLGVRNRGEPIPSDMMDRIFEPMFSSRDSDEQAGHLGLGLYVVKMIAESHEGKAYIKNEPPFVSVGLRIPVV